MLQWFVNQRSEAFNMDDLTVTTTTLDIQARSRVLSALEDSFSLARLKFKAKKSWCLVPRKGRMHRRVKVQIQGEEIPSIVGTWGNGEWIPHRQGEYQGHKEEPPILAKNSWWQWTTWKAQDMDLPAWDPTKTYMVSPHIWHCNYYCTVEAMERKVSRYLRRWLRVPSSFTSIGLYSNSITKLTSILCGGRVQGS